MRVLNGFTCLIYLFFFQLLIRAEIALVFNDSVDVFRVLIQPGIKSRVFFSLKSFFQKTLGKLRAFKAISKNNQQAHLSAQVKVCQQEKKLNEDE